MYLEIGGQRITKNFLMTRRVDDMTGAIRVAIFSEDRLFRDGPMKLLAERESVEHQISLAGVSARYRVEASAIHATVRIMALPVRVNPE